MHKKRKQEGSRARSRTVKMRKSEKCFWLNRREWSETADRCYSYRMRVTKFQPKLREKKFRFQLICQIVLLHCVRFDWMEMVDIRKKQNWIAKKRRWRYSMFKLFTGDIGDFWSAFFNEDDRSWPMGDSFTSFLQLGKGQSDIGIERKSPGNYLHINWFRRW